MAKNNSLLLKKQTIAAWAKILLNTGQIDQQKYNKMISLIDKKKNKK